MNTLVKLTDIIEGMEAQSFDTRVFINKKSAEVEYILVEFLGKAEDGESYDEMLEWHREMMQLAYDIINNQDIYKELPNEYEINEYDMMERFCYTMEDPKTEDALLNAIRGRGAFRRFKDLILKLGLEENWYDFREQSYKRIAIDFCKMNDISYIE